VFRAVQLFLAWDYLVVPSREHSRFLQIDLARLLSRMDERRREIELSRAQDKSNRLVALDFRGSNKQKTIREEGYECIDRVDHTNPDRFAYEIVYTRYSGFALVSAGYDLSFLHFARKNAYYAYWRPDLS
jgi:hypothetical protein